MLRQISTRFGRCKLRSQYVRTLPADRPMALLGWTFLQNRKRRPWARDWDIRISPLVFCSGLVRLRPPIISRRSAAKIRGERMDIRSIARGLVLSLVLSFSIAASAAAETGAKATDAATLADQRDETLGYAIGVQAYIYGYPAVDYMRVMREQTTPGLDRAGVYAPVNQIVFQDGLAKPGGIYAGRAPNTNTIYFTAWLDLSRGPVTVQAPDTDGRYYALTFADFYSDVQHTGRRTTGTKAQTIWVAGPGWNGAAPANVRVIRLRTHQGYLLGRVLVEGPKDHPYARKLMRKFTLSGPNAAPGLVRDWPASGDLTTLAYFRHLNAFLHDNPGVPGEEALMAQFDRIGIGPKVVFDESQLSSSVRRGLERAIGDARAIIFSAPRARQNYKNWSPIAQNSGRFGFDYFSRAVVEANGFLINQPEESVYPGALADANGAPFLGGKKYRIVFPAGGLPPHDAFWSLNAYDARTVDLIPNPIKRYGLSDAADPLIKRADGSVEIRVQREKPKEPDVNWLPVGDGPFFLTFRIYQPRPEVLDGRYKLPPALPVD